MKGNFTITRTFPGGGSALNQYDLVKTPGGAVVSAAATDDCFGITQNGYDANATEVEVCVFGLTRATASAAISKGDYLMAAAAGEVATHDGTSTKPYIGTALEAATAQGDEIEILFGICLGAGPAA